jgi:hypothetical protein
MFFAVDATCGCDWAWAGELSSQISDNRKTTQNKLRVVRLTSLLNIPAPLLQRIPRRHEASNFDPQQYQILSGYYK